MKNIMILICLFLSILLLWYYSIILPSNNAAEFIIEEHIYNVNNWFSMMSLLAAIFSLSLVIIKFDSQKKQFDILTKQNSFNLEIIALSSLIQESDATLHRYDRWEAAGIKGDYVNAKSGVREKMNSYRDKLESRFEQINLNREVKD
ncbi:MAG: hypothetical protein OQK46_01300 [Gammaproteobacteria bacterium]|nr:hypothetical protein [Gammaproteobacteria bacterium]